MSSLGTFKPTEREVASASSRKRVTLSRKSAKVCKKNKHRQINNLRFANVFWDIIGKLQCPLPATSARSKTQEPIGHVRFQLPTSRWAIYLSEQNCKNHHSRKSSDHLVYFFFQKVKHLPLRLPVCWAPPGYSATESYHIQEPNVNHNTTCHQHWLGEMSGSPIHQFLQDTRVHAYIAYLPICTLIYLCVHVPTYDIWITDLQTLLWHLNCLWWLQNFHKTKRMEHYGTPEHPCSTGNTPWCTGRLAESPLTVTVFSNTVGSAMVQSSQYDWYKLIHIATNICKEDSFIVCMCFFSSAKKMEPVSSTFPIFRNLELQCVTASLSFIRCFIPVSQTRSITHRISLGGEL